VPLIFSPILCALAPIAVPPAVSRVGAKPQDSGEFGGYSSMQEFAMRDPKGCEAYLENSTQGYIK